MAENVDPDLIPIPDAADLLGLSVPAVHRLLKDGKLVAVLDEHDRRAVPRSLVAGGVVVKGLPAVITLLRDNRYSDEEIVDWLFRADDSLPGTPIQALRENRGTEIKRRAQSAGY